WRRLRPDRPVAGRWYLRHARGLRVTRVLPVRPRTRFTSRPGAAIATARPRARVTAMRPGAATLARTGLRRAAGSAVRPGTTARGCLGIGARTGIGAGTGVGPSAGVGPSGGVG